MKPFLFLLLSALLLFCGLKVGRAQNPELSAIDREVQLALQTWQAPGAAVVIVRPDRVVYAKGFGTREVGLQKPVTTSTLFPIASCSKAFTSTALAILVGEKKLDWDDPVRDHLPFFHLSDAHADALVTVRDLLCHRTGLGSHDYLWYRAPWPQDDMIRRVAKLPLSGQFRSSFAYQSIMYIAAGQIVAKQHPRSWEGFLRERILTPLGMRATVFTSTEALKHTDIARGHRRNRLGMIETMESYPMPEPNAAGSIHTNAVDLAKWLQFHLGDGSWRGKRLVSAATFGETHRAQNIIPAGDLTRAMNPDSVQLTYAMGWVLLDYRGVKVLTHAGMIDGFRCQFVILPDHGLAFGLMNNLHATKMNLALSNRLIDLLLGFPEKDWHAHFGALAKAEEQGTAEERRRREERRKRGEKPTLPWAAYAGEYEHPAYGVAKVRGEDNKLTLEWSAFKRPLLAISKDTFELRDVVVEEQEITFSVANGKVVKLAALGVDFTRKE